MNKKILEIAEKQSDWGIREQSVYDPETDDELFNVCDLTECPEDATINRDLFNADDYLRAVRYGIDLAKAGYDQVEYVSIQAETSISF